MPVAWSADGEMVIVVYEDGSYTVQAMYGTLR